jgi:hypothetical protein
VARHCFAGVAGGASTNARSVLWPLNVPSVHMVVAVIMYAALHMAAVCIIKDCRRVHC